MQHTRHIGIFNAAPLTCTVIGAGGIGAFTAFTLAKMGVGFLNIIDGDIVASENLATQFHALESLGMNKAEALKGEILRYADDTEIITTPERIAADGHLYGHIVISAVDSIASRKAIWSAVCHGRVRWYLDARMAAEEFHLFAVDMNRGWGWYSTIIDRETDENIQEIPCTQKSTIFCSALSAAIVGRTVRMIATGITPPRYFVQNLITDTVFSMHEG